MEYVGSWKLRTKQCQDKSLVHQTPDVHIKGEREKALFIIIKLRRKRLDKEKIRLSLSLFKNLTVNAKTFCLIAHQIPTWRFRESTMTHLTLFNRHFSAVTIQLVIFAINSISLLQWTLELRFLKLS